MKAIYCKSIVEQVKDIIAEAGSTEAIKEIIVTPSEWLRLERENPKLLCEYDFIQRIVGMRHGRCTVEGVTIMCPADI